MSNEDFQFLNYLFTDENIYLFIYLFEKSMQDKNNKHEKKQLNSVNDK